MIASQAVRLVSAAPRRSGAGASRQRVGRAGLCPPRPSPTQRAARRARPVASWDLRLFGFALAAIALAFGLALLYVTQTTALSVAGYEVQKLAAQRDELQRQNMLLEVQSNRLDSPARIAADAKRLGMVHARYVPVIPAQPPLTAKR